MDEELKNLKAAREIISDPARWTQEAPAKNSEGDWAESVYSEDAVCWCALGALWKVSDPNKFGDYLDYPSGRERLEKLINDRRHLVSDQSHINLPVFNDSVTHAQILQLFDDAICEIENI